MEARPRCPVISTQSEHQSVFVWIDGIGAHINPDHREDDPLTSAHSTTFAATAAANNLVEPLLALADQFLKIRPIVSSHSSLLLLRTGATANRAPRSEQSSLAKLTMLPISLESELIQSRGRWS